MRLNQDERENAGKQGCIKDTIKTYLKKIPFLYRTALFILISVKKFMIPFSKIRFEFAIMMGRPYFGAILVANQVQPERYPIMQKLISLELEDASASFRILEIGSWAGQSTILWASICKKNKKGKVFCIDTWKASRNVSRTMQKATRNDRIFNLFLHNIKTSGLRDYIVILNGSSDTVCEILESDAFDFVYIDGDHAYTQFRRDLLNYMRVVKVNGIICGDDLELRLEEVDIINAKNHCEEDFIMDPNTRKYFHPGITLAIDEVFGSVSMQNGFWAVKKLEKGWGTVSL